MKNPFRREVLNPGGDAILIRDTSKLDGDERIHLVGGLTVSVADLMAGLDEIPVEREPDGRQ